MRFYYAVIELPPPVLIMDIIIICGSSDPLMSTDFLDMLDSLKASIVWCFTYYISSFLSSISLV